MEEPTLEQKAESVCQASQKVTEQRLNNRKTEKYKGKFGKATVQDVITDKTNLNEDEHIKFELKMPDHTTIRYISFSEEEISKEYFEQFLSWFNTTPQEMNVLYGQVPVVYTDTGWKISYQTDILASAVRDGTFFSVGENGMFLMTRWFLLTSVLLFGSSALLTHSLGYNIELIVLVWLSILFQPAFISWFDMDNMYTRLQSLSLE